MAERLAAFGWQAVAPPERLRIDGIHGDDFQIGRAWSAAGGSYESIPSDGSLYGLLPVEGDGVVTYDGEAIRVDQDHLIVLDGAADISVDTPNAVGRYIWRFKPELLRGSFYQRLYGEPIRVRDDSWRPIAALIGATMGRRDSFMSRTAHLRRANEHLLADLIQTNLTKLYRRRSENRDPVVAHSQYVIETSFHLQSFTVMQLAQSVGVSERTLRRRYASIGTTPRAEIARRRAVAAIALADDELSDPAGIAERTGFTSVVQMRATCERLRSQTNVLQRAFDLELASSLAHSERQGSEVQSA